MDPMEFILRFTISNPDLDTTIVGTLDPAHVRDNVEVLLKGPLPADMYKEARRRVRTVEPVGSVAYLRRGGA
jgi:aryl-alcohol dehydrogenase-like predicted oxidoreductase